MLEPDTESSIGYLKDPLTGDVASVAASGVDRSSIADQMTSQLREALVALPDSIEINVGKRGGVPVLKGTRVPIAQILAELASNYSVSEIADDLDLSEDLIRGFLEGLADHLNRSFFE